MGAALDQSFFVELVQHAHKSDGLQIEPGRNFGLANTLVAGDVEHDCSLPPGDRQAGLPRPSVEAPLDQPGDIVHQEPKIATETRLCLGLLDPGFKREIAWRGHRPDLTRRHDVPPPGLVSAYPTGLPARVTVGTAGRPSGRSGRGIGR